ncbi:hypothetical protein [Streptomyces chartreusis]|uniref:hypothetical protein n=1 Tax=Streptomyces chartreusis TaxID=1969 RepID=UPI00363C4473
MSDSQWVDAAIRVAFGQVPPGAPLRIVAVVEDASSFIVRLADMEKSTVSEVRVTRAEAARALRAEAGEPSNGHVVSGGQPRLRGSEVLRYATCLLPVAERDDWLEEQRGYLVDMPSRRARWRWIVAQLAAMPRFAYTVRTGREKESV